jgi:hypothetical protein
VIARINATVEKMLREAIGSVPHIDPDQIPAPLAALDDQERTEVLALAGIVTGYVVIDVCDAKWPNQASIRQIADDLATRERRPSDFTWTPGRFTHTWAGRSLARNRWKMSSPTSRRSRAFRSSLSNAP